MTTATAPRRPLVPNRRDGAAPAKTNPAGKPTSRLGQTAEFVTKVEFDETMSELKGMLNQLVDMFSAPHPEAKAPIERSRPKRRPVPQPAHDPEPVVVPEGEEDAGAEGETARPRSTVGDPVPLSTLPTPADNICGSEGTVKIGSSDLPEITKWSFKPTVALQEYASNRTGGFKRKVCGSKSGSGSIEGKWDANDPITDHFAEGSSVQLKLYLDGSRLVTMTAIVKSLDLEVDINDNSIDGWTAEFDADGEWVYTIAANA